jgi:hypothetical protein
MKILSATLGLLWSFIHAQIAIGKP